MKNHRSISSLGGLVVGGSGIGKEQEELQKLGEVQIEGEGKHLAYRKLAKAFHYSIHYPLPNISREFYLRLKMHGGPDGN